jgi:hypothetical protein
MTEPLPSIDPEPDGGRESAVSSDILIGRIIDGEAGPDDRHRFESLADADPKLWRRLALRQQDMSALTLGFDQELKVADRIELPEDLIATPQGADAYSLRARGPWVLAIAGWAAVITVAAIWAFSVMRDGHLAQPPRNALPASGAAAQLTPDDHLREYLQAPFVFGELPPTLLKVEEMSDGRMAVRVLRRIEEVIFLPPDNELPVNEEGDLTKPPGDLRSEQPPVDWMD